MVLEAMDLFPVHVMENTRVMFVNFGDVEAAYAMRALSDLRDAGISCELYPDAAKMGKQMAYADKRRIPFVVMAGSQEIHKNNYTLKCLSDGEQKTVTLGELIDALKA
jgi:histidyl-tRNA synthetase